jgi:hypothetical protein
MAEDSPISLMVAVGYEHSSDDELDALTRALRSELDELGLGKAELTTAGRTPDRAKASDPVTLGALAIAVLPVVLPKLIDFLENWMKRDGERKIKLTCGAGDKRIEIELPADAKAVAAAHDLLESARKATTA